MKEFIKIPLGAKDSELGGWEYTIPEGYTASIENGKIIVKKEESEDESIRKTLIHIVKGACSKYGIKYQWKEISEEKLLAWLEKQSKQKPTDEEMKILLQTEYEKGKADAIEQKTAWSEEDDEGKGFPDD